MEQLVNGFLPSEKEEFRPLYDYLLQNNDEFFVLKDFSDYCQAQSVLEGKFRDRQEWLAMCVKNIAHSGHFSSDRTIAEYAVGIWGIRPSILLE